MAWAPDGSFLTTPGRPGEGPGEFDPRGGLALFVDNRDQLHVKDSGGYWSTFSPSLEFVRKVRSASMGGRPGFTALTDEGVLVTSQRILSDPHHQFHVMTLNGDLVRGIAPTDQRQPTRRTPEQRPIAHGGGTTFWAGPAAGDGRGYVIEEWTLTGQLRRVIRRDVPWFTIEMSGAPNGPADRPPPFVESIHADTAGLVTTFIVTPNEDWRHVPDSDDPTATFPFFDGIVEVIDTRAGVVLASRRMSARTAMDEIHGLFAGVRLGYRMRESGDGLPIVEIVRLFVGPA